MITQEEKTHTCTQKLLDIVSFFSVWARLFFPGNIFMFSSHLKTHDLYCSQYKWSFALLNLSAIWLNYFQSAKPWPVVLNIQMCSRSGWNPTNSLAQSQYVKSQYDLELSALLWHLQELEEFVEGSGEHGIVVFTLGSLVASMPAEKAAIFFSAFSRIPQRVREKERCCSHQTNHIALSLERVAETYQDVL